MSLQVEIVRGNILNVHAEAVVLPANKNLKEGSGVSTAIFQAAGRKQLTEACSKIGSCEEGKAVVTPGFDLKSDYIIHTVVPKWVDGNHDEYQRLCTAYLAALNISEILGCKSIAFPLLGSGNNGYDLEIAFEIACQTIKQFEGQSLNKVYIVIFGDRISELVTSKGIAFNRIPDEPMKRTTEHKHPVKEEGALEKAMGQVGAFLGKKENWDMMLDVAERIIGIVLKIAVKM